MPKFYLAPFSYLNKQMFSIMDGDYAMGSITFDEDDKDLIEDLNSMINKWNEKRDNSDRGGDLR